MAGLEEHHVKYKIDPGLEDSFFFSEGVDTFTSLGCRFSLYDQFHQARHGMCTWAVQIHLNEKRYRLGYFTDEIDAAKAYDKKAKELHGEFAYLNFPPVASKL